MVTTVPTLLRSALLGLKNTGLLGFLPVIWSCHVMSTMTLRHFFTVIPWNWWYHYIPTVTVTMTPPGTQRLWYYCTIAYLCSSRSNVPVINMKWRWCLCTCWRRRQWLCISHCCGEGIGFKLLDPWLLASSVLTIVSLQQVAVILTSSVELTSHRCWATAGGCCFFFFMVEMLFFAPSVFVGRF